MPCSIFSLWLTLYGLVITALNPYSLYSDIIGSVEYPLDTMTSASVSISISFFNANPPGDGQIHNHSVEVRGRNLGLPE
jgi:hypothetical protein